MAIFSDCRVLILSLTVLTLNFTYSYFLFILIIFIFVITFIIIIAMAEEMGISMDRFDVVRRAMALAAHSSDNTPALAGMLVCHVGNDNCLLIYIMIYLFI